MFIKKNKKQNSTKSLERSNWLYSSVPGKVTFLQKMVEADGLTGLTSSFQVGRLMVTFLEEVETATRLAIKCCFVDVGLSTCDSILELVSF